MHLQKMTMMGYSPAVFVAVRLPPFGHLHAPGIVPASPWIGPHRQPRRSDLDAVVQQGPVLT